MPKSIRYELLIGFWSHHRRCIEEVIYDDIKDEKKVSEICDMIFDANKLKNKVKEMDRGLPCHEVFWSICSPLQKVRYKKYYDALYERSEEFDLNG